MGAAPIRGLAIDRPASGPHGLVRPLEPANRRVDRAAPAADRAPPTCKIEPQIAAFLVDGALLWIAIRSSGMGQHGRCSRRNGGLPDRSEVLAVTRDGAVGQPLRLPYRSAYPWLRLVDGRLLGRQQDPGSRRRRSVGFRIECADR
jgi:hypothetical protein